MKKHILSVALTLTVVLLAVFHYKLKPVPDEIELNRSARTLRGRIEWQGQIAPNFEIKALDGQNFRLADNVGKKVVVLNFFATWCAPCRAEMPELSRYYAEHNSEFILFGIDIDESSDKVTDFLKELKVGFPAGVDHGPIQKQYAVDAYPTTVVIGVDGKVQSYEAGEIANADVAFDELLRKNRDLLKAGKSISQVDYLAQAQAHTALPVHEFGKSAKDDEDSFKLDERGKRIAAKMPCPCGCDDKVEKCSCSTSTKIKKALATEDFGTKPDDQIMNELNKKYCMRGM